MKRWIFTILLFLLLGAIVNVAVAWGIAARYDNNSTIGELKGHGRLAIVGGQEWSVYLVHSFGRTSLVSQESSARARYRRPPMTTKIPRWRRPRWAIQKSPGTVCEHTFGWPWRSLYYGHWNPSRPWEPWLFRDRVYRYGVVLPEWQTDARGFRESAVPLCPLWPGFAVNAAFYAFILWLLVSGPFVLRWLIRRRRGRCPKCGYDLRGAPSGGGCPECGWNRQTEATA